MTERLGFRADEMITDDKVKRHYFVLAKHYHPDNPNAPPRATEAFQNIKEAHDIVSASVKNRGPFMAGGGHNAPAGGFQYADEATRRGHMRVLGDSVTLFLLMTFLFIYIVSRHNKDRLHSRYLVHFLGIFFVIQLFPRLLGAAFIFAWHTSYLTENHELQEQAAVTLVVKPNDKDLCIALSGIDEKVTDNVVVQVDTEFEQAETIPKTEGPPVISTIATTLTFDGGVTTFTVPLPPSGKGQTTYHVKAVDEKRKFVLLQKSFSL